MSKRFTRLQQVLATKRNQHLYRATRIANSPQQPQRIIDGRTILTFCSNDYLGLANHPLVIKAFQQAANEFGVGAGAAHLVQGHTRLHQELEEHLAAFTQRDRALLFSTGYMANLGVVNALVERHDTVYQDRLNHASLIDAGLLSGAKLIRYPHNDMTNLTQRLTAQTQGQALILSDGVFSMDGDKAPLKELVQLAQQHDAWLMVDDAHGFGVLGQTGAGLVEEQGLTQDELPILMGTLGKALGTSGAFVAGNEDLIEYLVQTARTWIFTTAQPAAIAAATLASLNLLTTESWRRDHLRQLIYYFTQSAQTLNLPLLPSATPIQPLLVGSSEKALHMSQQLEAQGIMVVAIRPPTVPPNTARLRITLSAAHTFADIDRLLEALATLTPTTG